jgi:hypothetical protein
MSFFDHARNRSRKKGNRTLKHPYAAIEHRVIDSGAFADLKPSSVVLLLILARQLTPTNNGHLQATWKYCKSRGFGSEVTLKNAIADLIKHGFVYRARSRGPNKAWARYAVTWLPIKQKEGLFLQNFEIDMWKRWEKTTPKKVKDITPKICSFSDEEPTEIVGSLPIKSNDYESIPNINKPVAHLKPVGASIAEISQLIPS